MLQAVFFGLRGTLVEHSAGSYRRALVDAARAVAAPVVEFTAAWEELRQRRETEAAGTLEEDLDDVLRRLGVFARPDQRAAAIDLLIDSEGKPLRTPYPAAIEAVSALKARKIKVGLIANEAMLVARGWAETPLASHFDDAVFSSEVGIALPDRRLYLLACERLGVEPAHSVFASSGVRDLAGATTAGMRAVRMVLRSEGEEDVAEGQPGEWPRASSFDEMLQLVDQENTA